MNSFFGGPFGHLINSNGRLGPALIIMTTMEKPMNILIRLSALFAFAMFGMGSYVLTAQEDGFEFDEQKIEQWAEKHAEAWEKWGENFESKMERWAESQEKQWADWADKYSQSWEAWGEKLEAGDIDPDEIEALVERNLEMLKDMPLDSLIDGALKEGLGGFKNAPFDSLADLNELIGGSLEQSLKAMEKELSMVAGSEIKDKLKDLKTQDLHEAIKKLQGAIEIKQSKSNRESAGTLARLEAMIKKSADLGEKEKANIMEILQRELSDARALQVKIAEDDTLAETMNSQARAMAAADKAKEMAVQAEHMARAVQKNRADLAKQKDLTKLKKRKADALMAAKAKEAAEKLARQKKQSYANLKKEKANLERYYANLKTQKESLESKESAIAAMKREIQDLRKEVERMKKQASKKKD